jgi:hypothetical protein
MRSSGLIGAGAALHLERKNRPKWQMPDCFSDLGRLIRSNYNGRTNRMGHGDLGRKNRPKKWTRDGWRNLERKNRPNYAEGLPSFQFV